MLKQFCGGQNEDDCKNLIQDLNSRNVYSILDYSVEGLENELSFEETVSRTLNLIELNTVDIFKERIVDGGIKKAFKGNWGAEAHTKRLGVVQDLNRLSYNSALAQLRKINLSMDASAKITAPLLLHSSQWGMIDPVDTPDGGNVGLHKHMSIAVHITSGCSLYPMINWMRRHANMRLLSESSPYYISTVCKVIINGNWVGTIGKPIEIEKKLKEYRRSGLLPIYTSIYWNISENTLYIYTDSGRLCRPIYYIDNKKPSYDRSTIIDKLLEKNFTWSELLSGFAKKKDDNFTINSCHIYENVKDLYAVDDLEKLDKTRCVVDFIDNAAPHLVSPSSFVKITPSKFNISLKVLAVLTASCPVIESTTNKVS